LRLDIVSTSPLAIGSIGTTLRSVSRRRTITLLWDKTSEQQNTAARAETADQINPLLRNSWFPSPKEEMAIRVNPEAGAPSSRQPQEPARYSAGRDPAVHQLSRLSDTPLACRSPRRFAGRGEQGAGGVSQNCDRPYDRAAEQKLAVSVTCAESHATLVYRRGCSHASHRGGAPGSEQPLRWLKLPGQMLSSVSARTHDVAVDRPTRERCRG
jgi:hypothetical protein